MATGRIVGIVVASLALAAVCVTAVLYQPELTRQELALELGSDASKFQTLSSGATMHYRDQGKQDAPALVMIHGGFGSLHSWEGWIAPLASQYRLISMDLLGHGLTGASPQKHYARRHQRDAIHELLIHLGVDQYALAGSSLGAAVALELALMYPNEVQALILIDAEGFPKQAQNDHAAKPSNVPALAPDDPSLTQLRWHERLAPRFVGDRVVRNALESMFHDQDAVSDDLVNQFAKALRHEGNGEAQILMFRQNIYETSTKGQGDLQNKLHQLSMPTLILQGEHDKLVPMSVAKQLNRDIQNSSLEVVREAGHLPMLEKPLKSAKLVREFLDAKTIKDLIVPDAVPR